MIEDASDLPLLRSLPSSFPANARGNIILELPDDRRPLLSAPPGITTSVLPRSLPSVLHAPGARACVALDRKSTRLNSSHVAISYAVFCLKKKNRRTRPKSTHCGGLRSS